MAQAIAGGELCVYKPSAGNLCRFFIKKIIIKMNMKKILVSILALFAGVFFCNPVMAATAEELAIQLRQLQEQLTGIQAQNATNGNLSGTVESPVVLGVTQITAVKTYAMADGSFENGWQWVFDITVPANETILKMKFTDWANGANMIPANGNIRFYSTQSINANNAGNAIVVAGAGEYSEAMNINPENTSDLDLSKAGRQIRITMETRVPTGSAGGSYTTSYGINTEVDPNVVISGQGDIIVTTNPIPVDNTRVYEGDNKVAIYAMKIKASGSNMDIRRVTLKFNRQPYSYFSRIYLYDGMFQIATIALDSTTVSKVADNDYEVTLSGLTNKFIVANETYKALTVKVDVLPGISSGLLADGIANVAIANPNINSVHAVDGLGFNHYGGDIAGRSIIVNQNQSTNATLVVSLNSNTPQSRNIIADTNSNINGATLLTFDVKATEDNLLLDEINDVVFTISDGYKLPQTAYLIDDGGTVIATTMADQSNGRLNFTDLNYTIPKDATKMFAIKIDDAVADNGSDDGKKYQVSLSGIGIVATKSNGAELADDKKSGSAQSNNAFAYAKGPIFTLTSVTTTNTQAAYSGASSTISATFNVQIQGVSGDVYIPKTGAFAIDYEMDGVNGGMINNITYTQPSGAISGSNAYKICEGTSVTFAVSATKVANVAGNYDLIADEIKWGLTDIAAVDAGIKNSNYMADNSWISATVYLR